MKKLIRILILSFLVILKISIAKAEDVIPIYSSDPKLFVQELVNDSIEKLSDVNLNEEQKKAFVKKVALENVDISALGLYALGELRKTTEAIDIDKYQVAFKEYFLKTLINRLSNYSSNKFEITSAEKKSPKYTIVKSRMLPNENKPEIKIDWRIFTKNPDKPLIRDLIVEGLSLARAQKEEFASILNSNNNDINILILKLEEFLNN